MGTNFNLKLHFNFQVMLYSQLSYFELGPKKFDLSYFLLFPRYTIFLSPVMLFLSFPLLSYDALNMNPQEERSLRSSRFSRGKILKRKDSQEKNSQEPQEERSSRSSRSSRRKILKRKVFQELQEERSSRFSRSSRGKFLNSLKRMFGKNLTRNVLPTQQPKRPPLFKINPRKVNWIGIS